MDNDSLEEKSLSEESLVEKLPETENIGNEAGSLEVDLDSQQPVTFEAKVTGCWLSKSTSRLPATCNF